MVFNASSHMSSLFSSKLTSDLTAVEKTSVDNQQTPEHQTEKGTTATRGTSLETSDDDSSEKVDLDAQHGVQAQQAMTQVWTKRDLITAYIFMWLIAFIVAFANGVTSTLTPYVTSSFNEHSLTALTGVISSLIAGLFKLPYAKIMNIWGRPFALWLGIAMLTVALIMMAACQNVQTYCAAQVFFYTGLNCVNFSITVFIADTSKLKNRALWIAFASSPYLITTWTFGEVVESVLAGPGFRWGFGIFAIVVPLVCAPLPIILWLNERKASRAGLLPPRPAKKGLKDGAIYYAHEFDFIGLFILAFGLALFLLAFNLYSYQAQTWRSPMIISFIVIGFLLVIVFGVWEKYGAKVTFVPWDLLKNRTVVFTYTMALGLYVAWYIWSTYFYSLLIVLFNASIPHATYITNIYTIGSCFICLVYGVCLRYYGKLKVYSLIWGVPLTVLGCGLMLRYSQPDQNIGYIVMCQIFIAFGGGVLVISEQTTLMAVSKQQDFPALLAVESMVIAIGSAIGSTIAGAMWTGIFPDRLLANLPASAQGNFMNIYGDITVQSGYAVGTPERVAIDLSYAQTQRYMLIAATCILSTMFVSVALWQNVDVRKSKQRGLLL